MIHTVGPAVPATGSIRYAKFYKQGFAVKSKSTAIGENASQTAVTARYFYALIQKSGNN